MTFGAPAVDLDHLAGWKDGVVNRLTAGLAGLARQRKVTTSGATASSPRPHHLRVEPTEGDHQRRLRTGDHRGRRRTADAAVHALRRPAGRRLHRGAVNSARCRGGCSSSAAGSSGWRWPPSTTSSARKVTIVELMDQLIPGADRDLINPLAKRSPGSTRTLRQDEGDGRPGAERRTWPVYFDGPKAPATDTFDRILVAVGRSPTAS